MTRWLVYAATAALALAGSTGCGSTCGDMCSHFASCSPDFMFGDYDCDWKDDEGDVEDACLDACENEYDKLSDGDAEEVDACVECVMEEVGDSCSANEMNEVVADDCEDECDDSAVDEFFSDFIDDWDPEDDVECDAAPYPA